MLLNSVSGMNLYEKEQDAEIHLYQKSHPGLYSHDFDPMSYEMTKIPMQLQVQQQQKAQYEQRRERKKLPVEEHEHWVALVWTEANGKPHLRSSSNMRFCKSTVLEEALPKFTYYVNQEKSGGYGFNEGLPFAAGPSRIVSREQRPQKRKKPLNDVDSSDEGGRTTFGQYRDDEANAHTDRSTNVSFRADAKEEWAKWFYNAFRAVQQQACRTIAKEWIKAIHPKKQSTHPYNGKDPKTGVRGDPASTKPPYWPAGVQHKEPDHINKEDRCQLLVHLLMNTPHQEMSISGEPRSTKEITAAILKEPLDTKKHENVNKELLKRFAIVESIIDVRTQLEMYENGGICGDSMIYAPDYSSYNRGIKAEDESDDYKEEEMGEAIDTNENTDETDGRTESASEDADYVLLSRQVGLPGPSMTEREPLQSGRRRKSKVRQRHGSRTDDAQAASFVSTCSSATNHSMAPQSMGVPEASSISPEWQMLRHNKSDSHSMPHSHMFTPDPMWRHPMSMQMPSAPFPEHGLISPPPHHITGGAIPVGGVPMTDGRFMNASAYCHPPMHSGGQYMRHPEYADIHDPRGIPIRSKTPQELFMGHPTPPGNPILDSGYYR